MVSYKNILVIQTAFIGDAILAASLLEKLHHCFPQVQLSILVRKGNESIFSNHPFLKEVLVWNKTTSKYVNLYKLLFKIRKSKFDCVVNCHRFASSGLLTAFSGARHKTGYIQTPFSFLFDTTVKHIIGNGSHEVERYNQLIEDFTNKEVFKPKLYPSVQDFEKVKSFKQTHYFCFAPASVWFTKQLGKNKWIELSNKLSGSGTIYLLGSSADEELCESIKSESNNKNIVNLAGKINLLQSCALMKDAEMNYVNDSAPLHLASAMNAPVKAFFCSTVPAFGFTPLSDNREIIEVLNLDCRPCGLHGHKACPKGHFKCSNDMVI
ncbi:MAG: glycosyltransferase family 9 protein [Bacteroidota bacterium]|nr:glycosyltransferase family 9 protein [Bacteroidota bacterium]